MKNKSVPVLAPVFALFLGSVLFADFMPSVFDAYADQRVLLSLLLIAATALGLLMLSYKGRLASLVPDLWPFLLLVFSFLLAALQYHTEPFYLVEPVFYALYFLAFGIGGYVIRTKALAREAAQALLVVAAIACFFYAAMTITVYLFALSDEFSQLDLIIPWGFVNIRYWSHVATWVVPLFPLFVLVGPCQRNRLWQLGAAFTGAVWWWVLFLSSSRGSVIGLFIGFVLAWACFGRAGLPWVKLFAKYAIYGVVAWFILSVAIPSLVFDEIQVRGLKAHSSGRLPLWQEAWAMSMQHFPFGMGPQSWLTHEILTDAYRASRTFGHPHNMYLMWAAEYGWISIAGLAILCCYALCHLWRQIALVRAGQTPNGILLVGFMASVLAALVHAGVSAVFIAPGSMLVGLLVLTVFWAFIKPEPAGPTMTVSASQSRRSRLAGYGLAIAFLVGSMVWFYEVLRYQQAMTDDLDFYQSELSLGNTPRFWLHGNFPRHPSQMPPHN
ncbi:MAG: hypothetical protein CMM07_16080 [Rhodopirellula sp.]|jgi:O-antigen ligase|nr:hypothetical protein [Rhodopirellula sp.]